MKPIITSNVWLWYHMNVMASQIIGNFNVCSMVFQQKTNNGEKLHITGPLCGESTDDQWIPLTKGK